MAYAEIESMIGKVMTSVELSSYKECLTFCSDDGQWDFYNGNYGSNVNVEDYTGDLDDLVGVPILMAEEITNLGDLSDAFPSSCEQKWTFYKFATVKGYVIVRWYGTSNGYYSVDVDLRYRDSHQNN